MSEKCPRCGESNACGIAAGKSTCWCFAHPASGLKLDPEAHCLCPRCLQAVIDQRIPFKVTPASSSVVSVDQKSEE